MAIFDNIAILLASAFDLLKGAFILAIPVFLFVLLGGWLKKRLEAWRRFSWLQSAFLSIYIIATLLILVLYYGGYLWAMQFYTGGAVPVELQPTPEFALIEGTVFILVTLAKKLLTGLALSLIILPFAVIGSLVLERLGQGKKAKKKAKQDGKWLRLFAGVFITTALAYLLILVFDFIPAGVIYLIFNF